MNSEKGESLIEVLVSATVGILVVSALTFATIFSLRNAQFAKNSSQATKLAQEGIEKVRLARDRAEAINGFNIASNVTVSSWEDPNLWSYSISANCRPNCYFKFNGSVFQYLGVGSEIPANPEDPLNDGKFKRVVILSDVAVGNLYQTEKTITVVVNWNDSAGPHESRLTTILRKL